VSPTTLAVGLAEVVARLAAVEAEADSMLEVQVTLGGTKPAAWPLVWLAGLPPSGCLCSFETSVLKKRIYIFSCMDICTKVIILLSHK